jgi:hypothetical protein
MKKYLIFTLICCFSIAAFAHNINGSGQELSVWHLKNKTTIHGSFLMSKGNDIFIENELNKTIKLTINAFEIEDLVFLQNEIKHIQNINNQRIVTSNTIFNSRDFTKIFVFSFLLIGLLFISYIAEIRNKFRFATCIFIVGLSTIFFSFKPKFTTLLGTDPLVMDMAFQPFKPNVFTRWDNNFFYVESKGIPTTHAMMKGITSWQQQFPIPQCYIGSNPWTIPLNPVLATTPVPVDQNHFLKGAIAVAANGIAIFNPYTNTGVDAQVDGQLDMWGGHCGRADDYHYHTAPLHLYTTTAKTNPIAYALDGYAVYGDFEPNGVPVQALDVNHGHTFSGVYHYHGTTTAPYMIKNMVGKVTEDATLQIIPQAAASPIRPAGTPLKGATITDCSPNAAKNGYVLTYTLNNQTYKVDYTWNSNGLYTFNFINPGATTTSTYNGFKPCAVPTASEDIALLSGLITLYPNPTSQDFTLNLNGVIPITEIKEIAIYNLEGKKIFGSEKMLSKFSTSGYAKGLYSVQIITKNNLFIKKLLVQ